MKKIFKRKKLLFSLMLLIGFYFSYKTIEEKKPIKNNHQIVEIVLQDSFQEKSIMKKLSNTSWSWDKSIRLLKNDYKLIIEETEIKKNDPIIYLYNSHPTEEYASSIVGEYSLNPTVIMNNYIIEDILEKNAYTAYVEETSVKRILDQNNWNYASSYKASRLLLEQRIEEYPTLKYFIDIHRDSLEKERTTIQIGDRSYAKILFIVGLENDNYEANLAFTEKIQEKIESQYPGLSKGIYKKEGPGVNGIYNQDFSPRTILVEVGGYENTTIEVLNTDLAFAKCFLEVIHEENS